MNTPKTIHQNKSRPFVVFLIVILVISGCVPSQPNDASSFDNIIKDLDHVVSIVVPAGDEDSPFSNGIAIVFGFSDSKDKGIEFEGIPVIVSIKLYGYREEQDAFEHDKMELVFQKQITIYRSRLADNSIILPFEDIKLDENSFYKYGTIDISFITPNQGVFQNIYDDIQLYDKPQAIAPSEGTRTIPVPFSDKVIIGLTSIWALSIEWDDGIDLHLIFFDSEGHLIDFQEIPLLVIIRLFGYKKRRDYLLHENMEIVYEQQVILENSMTYGKSDVYIWIPFENIEVDRNKYQLEGTISVTIKTPQQGEFQDIDGGIVHLYSTNPIEIKTQGD